MEKPYWLPDRAYQVMKWLGLVALPALGVLLGTVLPAFGVGAEAVNAAVVCVSAVGTFVGSLIGVSAAKAYFATKE